jgi:segregation and condensation protein A
LEVWVLQRNEFIIKTGYFEGPFDLLLYLVKKQEVEIKDINISIIIYDYLNYLKNKEFINLDREADFITIAATLIFLKSRAVLPATKEDEEIESPYNKDFEILDKLKDFEHIKKIMEILENNYREERISLKAKIDYDDEKEFEVYPVSIYLLSETFFKLLKRREEKEAFRLKERGVNLKDFLPSFLSVIRKNSFLDFTDYFYNCKDYEQAFISFFALLELVKRRKIIAIQETAFGKILLFPKRRKKTETEIYERN